MSPLVTLSLRTLLCSAAAACALGDEPVPPSAPEPAVAPIPADGGAIYQQLCVECHGPKGEGVADKYDEALYGERSLASLAKYIDHNMPEDEEEKLDAAGSALVAQWVYDEFYSPAARARLHPAVRAPSRLTNRQFRESVADLIGAAEKPRPRGEPTGLHAEYYQSDGMNKKSKKGLEREDRALDFDFGDKDPVEGIPAEQYSISWDGSLLPDETGWHEFRLTTPNGARLYVNTDLRRGEGNHRDDSGDSYAATIDQWVSSGAEARVALARVYLLGGRAYPFRLDYFKYKDKTGSIRLEWKTPSGEWQVLGAPWISPAAAGYVTTISTTLPADDASSGYERGTAVSKAWHEATTKGALQAAASVADRMHRLARTREDEAERVDKLKAFLTTLAGDAFRRPLSDDLRALYIERPFADGVPPELAVKRAVLQILKSPRFLYPEATAAPDDFSAASRLALALWDSVPDAALTKAAEQGRLRTPEQIRTEAARMLDDPRARTKVRGFFHRWLDADEAGRLDKDRTAYPDFNATLVMDMRRSLDLFIDRVVWSEASDYREMLLADYLILNDRLARYFGVPVPEGGDFAPVSFDPARRAGIFTHPLLLTVLSYHKSSSPIHRGVFLTRNVMGRFLKPPPMAIEFMDDRFDPSLTMREKVTELTAKTSCMGCHATINPLGFSLENYDATGRWRETDNNKPVNAIAEYITGDGESVTLHGPRDLAEHAASDREARRGFIRHLFHSMVKQPPAAYGPETLARLEEDFTASNCSIRHLLVEIAVTAAAIDLHPPAKP